MEWNSILTKEFIEDYRVAPELWNHNISDYRDAEKRNARLRQLAAKYGCEVGEVKSKIKNLRSAYHRERKHAVLHGRHVKWFAYKALSFLKEVDSTIEPASTPAEMIANPEYEIKIEGEDDQESDSVDTPSAHTDAPATEFNSSEVVNNNPAVLFNNSDADSEQVNKRGVNNDESNNPTELLFYNFGSGGAGAADVNKPDVTSNRRAAKRIRKEPTLLDFDEDNNTSTFNHHRSTSSYQQHRRNSEQKARDESSAFASFHNHRNNYSEQRQISVGRDEFSTYGEYVANELRHLSYRSQVMAKHLINNTLFEAAMGKYEMDGLAASQAGTLQECNATVSSS